MRLANQVAIITGAARGIGKCIAQLFAQEGANVVIWDVLECGATTAAEIRATGAQAVFQKVSVTDAAAVLERAKWVFDTYGKIDILINNAGILRDKSLLKMDKHDWEQSVGVNLSGVFYCTRAVAPYMKKNGYGRIVSASSIVGLRGNYGQSNYAATKAGIIGMTKTWAIELGRFGITANAIAPGFTNTHMVASMPEKVKLGLLKQIPVGFIAEPIDIAHAYLYLASPQARFVNGICLTVDGGMSR